MAAQTKIEWADATVNFWIGCDAVSPGCDNCYAEELSERRGWARWGKDEPRHLTGPLSWNAPARWGRKPETIIGEAREAAGERPFVFVNSLSDFGDNRVPLEWFTEALDRMEVTPRLVYLILTKRPKVLAARLRQANRRLPPNVALGVSVVLPEEVDPNIGALLSIPGALFYFVSAEPLLGDIAPALRHWLITGFRGRRISWVIVGGESGARARPMNPGWVRNLRSVCELFGAVFNFKQWGEWCSVSEAEGPGAHHQFPDGATVRRIGRARDPHTLDGRAYLGRPDVERWVAPA